MYYIFHDQNLKYIFTCTFKRSFLSIWNSFGTVRLFLLLETTILKSLPLAHRSALNFTIQWLWILIYIINSCKENYDMNPKLWNYVIVKKKNIWFHSPRSKSTSWNQNVSRKEQSENTIWNYRFPFFPEVFIDATCIRVKIALEALGRSSTISVREALPSLSLHFVILILWIFYEAMALS